MGLELPQAAYLASVNLTTMLLLTSGPRDELFGVDFRISSLRSLVSPGHHTRPSQILVLALATKKSGLDVDIFAVVRTLP